MVSDISEPLKKVCFQTEILGIFGNSRTNTNFFEDFKFAYKTAKFYAK